MKEIWPLNFARKMHQKDAFNKKIIIIIIVGKHSEVNRPQSWLKHHPITAEQHIYGRYISQIICNLMRPRTQLNLTYILKEWIRGQLQRTEHNLELGNWVTANKISRLLLPSCFRRARREGALGVWHCKLQDEEAENPQTWSGGGSCGAEFGQFQAALSHFVSEVGYFKLWNAGQTQGTFPGPAV